MNSLDIHGSFSRSGIPKSKATIMVSRYYVYSIGSCIDAIGSGTVAHCHRLLVRSLSDVPHFDRPVGRSRNDVMSIVKKLDTSHFLIVSYQMMNLLRKTEGHKGRSENVEAVGWKTKQQAPSIPSKQIQIQILGPTIRSVLIFHTRQVLSLAAPTTRLPHISLCLCA